MWGLLGLKLCLEAKGSEEELAKVSELYAARSIRADIVPAKTCFCAQDSVKADSCCGGGARNSVKQRRKEREREIVCGKKRAWLLRGMVAMAVVKVVAVGIPLVRSRW